jgi:hypothetical protein
MTGTHGPDNLADRQGRVNEAFQQFELYFKQKEKMLQERGHVPIEEVLVNAPKYYNLIRVLEQLHAFVSKESDWLKNTVGRYGIDFDFEAYERWKSGKEYYKKRYTDTQAPSRWVHVLQDYFIELVKSLQILLIMEFYIDDESFKKFLMDNRKIDYKYKANYVVPSSPSDEIGVFFEVIDYLLDVNIQFNFMTNYVIDATTCMQVYRHIDKSNIFTLMKRKEFYVKYRIEFLKTVHKFERMEVPYENDIYTIAEDFLESARDLRFSYNEYKERLLEKYNKIKKRI